MDAPLRRLLPQPGLDLGVDDAYAGTLGDRDDRPWVGLCMVASIDGSTVVDGRSAGLSSPTDAAVLWRLRELADVILVGAGTIREEGYGAPRKRGQRVGVVTRSGRADPTSELYTSGAGFLVTTQTARVDTGGLDVDVVRAGDDSVDLALAIERIAELVPDCSFIQAEGGARLNGALLDADLLDEINVTTSPGTVGGDGPRLSTGAGEHSHRFELAQLALDEQSFLYARWLRRRG